MPEILTIRAPNPSPLTGPGTNTYLLGRDQVAVIDPGPNEARHRAAILEAGAGRISHIFVTHAHSDHSGGAAALAAATGAPVYAFGRATDGRSALMQRLAAESMIGGGEGLDHAFAPDVTLRDGDTVETRDWTIRAIHTPGHAANHLSFDADGTLFCGDIILGWSSTLISPPDGDLLDYFRSLERIDSLGPSQLMPGHGDPIAAPRRRVADLVAHRRRRTAEILSKLQNAPADSATLVSHLYDIPESLIPAARRNVLAHLIALATLGAVVPMGTLTLNTCFRVA